MIEVPISLQHASSTPRATFYFYYYYQLLLLLLLLLFPLSLLLPLLLPLPPLLLIEYPGKCLPYTLETTLITL